MKKVLIWAVPTLVVSAILSLPKSSGVSLLLSEDVEVLTKCESRDGYNLSKHCVESQGSKCYYSEYTADNCISRNV